MSQGLILSPSPLSHLVDKHFNLYNAIIQPVFMQEEYFSIFWCFSISGTSKCIFALRTSSNVIATFKILNESNAGFALKPMILIYE